MFNSNKSNSFTEIKEVSWISRLLKSLKDVFTGVIIIFIAFLLLIWNEGRYDLNQLAKDTLHLSADSAPQSQDIGKLVSITGLITSPEMLSDDLFLKPAPYIALGRAVEMYAWEESRNVESQTNLGGSQTQKITATYTQKWLSTSFIGREATSVRDNDSSIIRSTKSSSFLQPENHQNPPITIEDGAYKVSSAQVGLYELDMASFRLPSEASVREAFGAGVFTGSVELPTPTPIQARAELINNSPEIKVLGNYFYKGTGSLSAPEVGDLRIRYAALEANKPVTVMGKLEKGNRLVPYPRRGQQLYRIFPSSLEGAVARIEKEDLYFTWGLRFLGFLLLWFGLRLLFEPINILLDFFPIFGAVSRIISGYGTLLMAFSISGVTILVYRLIL